MSRSLREVKRQTRLLIAVFSFLMIVLGVSIDIFNGIKSEKIDTNPSVDTQVGQVVRVGQLTDSTQEQDTELELLDSQYFKVVKVVDGDTLTVQKDLRDPSTKLTLRLIGINTPETVDPRKKVECFGKEASDKAKEMLLGKIVRLEYDETQDTKDKYGRSLAYVYVATDQEDHLIISQFPKSTSTNPDDENPEIFFNKYMIASGFAYEYTYDKPYKYQKEFKDAQKAAEAGGLGLWSTNTCNKTI